MKVDSTLPNRVLTFIPKDAPVVTPQVMTSRKIVMPQASALRDTFERFAEEMDPQDYIKMRSYLSDIEMKQLCDSDIF